MPLMPMSQESYRQAVKIYIRIAYPDISPVMRFIKLSRMDVPNFWEKGLPPSEYRWGCFANGNMKIKIKDNRLMVFTNAIQDSEKVQGICNELKRKIEKEWEENDLPVYH